MTIGVEQGETISISHGEQLAYVEVVFTPYDSSFEAPILDRFDSQLPSESLGAFHSDLIVRFTHPFVFSPLLDELMLLVTHKSGVNMWYEVLPSARDGAISDKTHLLLL